MSAPVRIVLAIVVTVPATLALLLLASAVLDIPVSVAQWWTAAGIAFLVITVLSTVLVRQSEHIYRLNRQLLAMQVALQRLADHDPLTGLPNRMAFERDVERFAAGHVLLIDLDNFKGINDSEGHSAGDEVLSQVGQLIANELNSIGLAGRVGGEEFAVFVPMDSEASLQLAERLRHRIAALRPIVNDQVVVDLSASIGLAVRRAGEPVIVAMRAADRAMYRAKRLGRNRVEPEPVPV